MSRWLRSIAAALLFLCGGAGAALAQGGQISPCPLVANVRIVPDATYTLSTADYCWWIVFTNPGAITLLLPAPGQYFVPGFWTTFLVLGGGTVTMTGTQDQAGNIHKINLVTTAALGAGQGANLKVEQDLNWYAFTTGSTGGGGGCVGFGCIIPLGLGFSNRLGVDNQSPLTIGVDTLYGQTFDTDTAAASYTFAAIDASHLKTFSSSSLQAATLPAAGSAGFEQGSVLCYLSLGAGGMTLGTSSGVLLGVPTSGGLATVAQYGNGCAESSPPNWKVSAAQPATGTITSLSITATPCINATPNPITTIGTIATTIPFSVPCGGTGDVTLTTHSVLIGEGPQPVAFAAVGTAGRVLRDNGAGSDPSFTALACSDLPAGGCPFDIAMTWNGVPASYTNCTTPTDSCVNVAITRAVTCPAAFAGSIGLAQVASTGTKVVNVNQITAGTPTTRGTVTFTASATGVFASGSGMTLASGDLVQFAFPTTADATLADIAITLKCSRT